METYKAVGHQVVEVVEVLVPHIVLHQTRVVVELVVLGRVVEPATETVGVSFYHLCRLFVLETLF